MGILLGENGKKMLLWTTLALVLFLVFKYILPLLAPFLLAFSIVYLSYPWLKRVQDRTHIRKEILLGGLLILLAAAAVLGICWLVSMGTAHAAQIGDDAEMVRQQMDEIVQEGCIFLEKRMGLDAYQTRLRLEEQLQDFWKELRTDMFPKAAKQSMEYVKGVLGAAAFLGISFISSLLLCRDYETILQRTEENELLEKGWQFAEKTVAMAGSYLKAQLLILLAVFGIAAAGLFLGRIKGALFWGLLAGLLDSLPFIGTGIVLLPTALLQLFYGNIWGAVTAAFSYVLCIFAREMLEPKLLGRQTGIYPVLMLLSVYAGVRLFGIPGFFLGPLYVVLLREGSVRLRQLVSLC